MIHSILYRRYEGRDIDVALIHFVIFEVVLGDCGESRIDIKPVLVGINVLFNSLIFNTFVVLVFEDSSEAHLVIEVVIPVLVTISKNRIV